MIPDQIAINEFMSFQQKSKGQQAALFDVNFTECFEHGF